MQNLDESCQEQIWDSPAIFALLISMQHKIQFVWEKSLILFLSPFLALPSRKARATEKGLRDKALPNSVFWLSLLAKHENSSSRHRVSSRIRHRSQGSHSSHFSPQFVQSKSLVATATWEETQPQNLCGSAGVNSSRKACWCTYRLMSLLKLKYCYCFSREDLEELLLNCYQGYRTPIGSG